MNGSTYVVTANLRSDVWVVASDHSTAVVYNMDPAVDALLGWFAETHTRTDAYAHKWNNLGLQYPLSVGMLMGHAW